MGLWSVFRAWFGKFYSGVVVESVTPSYYAANQNPASFVLRGRGFNNLPSPIYGKISSDNDDPEQHRYESANDILLNVEVISDTELALTHRTEATFPGGSYVGVLANANGSEVYWINETRPLP